MRRHQLIPVDGRLENFLLQPNFVVAFKFIRQFHWAAENARQPIINRFIFRILSIDLQNGKKCNINQPH